MLLMSKGSSLLARGTASAKADAEVVNETNLDKWDAGCD